MRSYLSFRNQFETSSLVDRPLPVRGTLDHCCNLLCCEYLTMIAIHEWQRRPGKNKPSDSKADPRMFWVPGRSKCRDCELFQHLPEIRLN